MTYHCPSCDWTGTADELTLTTYPNGGDDTLCPKCGGMVEEILEELKIDPKKNIPNMVKFKKPIELNMRDHFIKTRFPINELYKAGFLKSKTDYDHIEERIKEFFGYDSIYQYGLEPIYAIVCPVNCKY